MLGAIPAGASCSWQCPHAGKARADRRKQRTAQPLGSTTKVVARELANPGEIRAMVWSNADQPSHTVTAAHTSTTLASVAGVRRVRTRGRGACLNLHKITDSEVAKTCRAPGAPRSINALLDHAGLWSSGLFFPLLIVG
jgi:hypothetical protein